MSNYSLTIKNVVGISLTGSVTLITCYIFLHGLYLGMVSPPPLGRAHPNAIVLFSDQPFWYLFYSSGWLLAAMIFARISWVILQSMRKSA